jgi:hypothetical protein
MLITSMILRIVDYRQLHSAGSVTDSQLQLECTRRLQATGECLAAGIPFSLGRFKLASTPGSKHGVQVAMNEQDIMPSSAGMAVWPLLVASVLEGVDSRQQMWFRSELADLGRVTGDGMLESLETS